MSGFLSHQTQMYGYFWGGIGHLNLLIYLYPPNMKNPEISYPKITSNANYFKNLHKQTYPLKSFDYWVKFFLIIYLLLDEGLFF